MGVRPNLGTPDGRGTLVGNAHQGQGHHQAHRLEHRSSIRTRCSMEVQLPQPQLQSLVKLVDP